MSRATRLHHVGVRRRRGNRDTADGTRDDDALADGELDAEPDVDAAQLQKAAAEGAARQPNRRELREKFTAADENFPRRRRNDDDFIRAVTREDGKAIEPGELIDMKAIFPRVVVPRAEDRRCWHR